MRGRTVLGVIPARAGSKRCPGKNTKLYKGKPLIQWTIECAQDSSYFDQLIVSTDDEAIAQLSTDLGCPALLRPDELATDHATSEDVLRHALTLYPMDMVVLLQPTSPLRRPKDIDICVEFASAAGVCVSYSDSGKNGAVYACMSEWLKTHDFTDKTLGYYMPDDVSLDIDYAEDFA